MEVNVRDAQERLEELIRRVGEGEEIVLLRAEKPVARLVAASAGKRIADLHPGAITMRNDFDDPLDFADDLDPQDDPLLSYIGGTAHGALAQNIDEDLYGA